MTPKPQLHQFGSAPDTRRVFCSCGRERPASGSCAYCGAVRTVKSAPPLWMTCNCAATPPTMPTCRAEHLPSCPLSLVDHLRKRLATLDAEREKSPELPMFHGRKMPNAERVMFAAAALEVQALLAMVMGAHDE